ncbi:MAG: tRNA ligase subunit PheS family protein, partial [Thermoguttaceae bacterium]
MQEIGAVQEIREQFVADLGAAASAQAVEEVRIKYLGRKGLITTLAKNTDFGKLTDEEKRQFGQQLNGLKTLAAERLSEAATTAKSGLGVKRGAALDLTLPGTGHTLGSLHPITLVQMELEDIFQGMGFMVLTGPDVETEHYNFDALNIPGDHPARDMQDTFWLKNGMLMKTHTSANQVRTLEKFGAPVRAIFPGRCFRYEAMDPSHETTFY